MYVYVVTRKPGANRERTGMSRPENVHKSPPRVAKTRRTAMAPLITLEQARIELGISRTTLYHLIRTGELEVIHLRGCKRIAPEALAKLTGREL